MAGRESRANVFRVNPTKSNQKYPEKVPEPLLERFKQYYGRPLRDEDEDDEGEGESGVATFQLKAL